MQAAQVLDVALGADDDLVLICAQYRSVPDRGRAAEGDIPDDDRAGRNPGLWMDTGAVTKRPDQVLWLHRSRPFLLMTATQRAS